MSDLVERLKIEASEDLDGEVRESAIEVMREAATALTAKDKEIEALRVRAERLESIAVGECRTANERLVEMANLQARAETAERERDCHKQMADKNYALWAEVSRERDEARTALEPFADVATHDIGGDERDADYFRPIQNNHAQRLRVGHLRAARAVIEQGE